MVFNPEGSHLESDLDEFFIDWYEIEGVKKITELSRQVRSLLNFKLDAIKYRFRSIENNSIIKMNTKFHTNKKKFESLVLNFIILLRNIKETAETLEEGIRSLYFNSEKSHLKRLVLITEQIFIEIHYFSEEDLHSHPLFLKILVKLVQEACLVKKCTNAQFSEFYEELGLNYLDLEKELDILIPSRTSEGKIIEEKQHDGVKIS